METHSKQREFGAKARGFSVLVRPPSQAYPTLPVYNSTTIFLYGSRFRFVLSQLHFTCCGCVVSSRRVMRLDKPVGFLLLYWPCTWGVAVASPPLSLGDFADFVHVVLSEPAAWSALAYHPVTSLLSSLTLFGLGAFFARSAGCVRHVIVFPAPRNSAHCLPPDGANDRSSTTCGTVTSMRAWSVPSDFLCVCVCFVHFVQ
jgi:hypothetical protein